MKKWWKRLELKLEGVSHGKKLAVNLVLCAFVLLLLWSLFGYPLPTAELEFRRMERTHLLPRSEIVFNSEKDCPIQWKDLPALSAFGHELMIGVEGNRVHVADLSYNTMDVWPLEEGITPVPLYNTSVVEQWLGMVHSGIPLLFLNVPAEAERAEVEIKAEGQYQGEGWRLAPGRWIFAARPGDSFSGSWYAGGSYTLTLYREDGSLLLEQNGTLPEE